MKIVSLILINLFLFSDCIYCDKFDENLAKFLLTKNPLYLPDEAKNLLTNSKEIKPYDISLNMPSIGL